VVQKSESEDNWISERRDRTEPLATSIGKTQRTISLYVIVIVLVFKKSRAATSAALTTVVKHSLKLNLESKLNHPSLFT
jgi:hypothetical protein